MNRNHAKSKQLAIILKSKVPKKLLMSSQAL